MREKILLFLIFFCLCFLFTWTQGIRKPISAGTYYYGNAERLSRQIDWLLQNAKKTPLPSEDILALIAPHAGYPCSGQTAASAYCLLRDKNYKTVVILAPSHRYGFEGCSIYLRGGYETPLGVAEIDGILASELSKASGFKFAPKAHKEEHSVEVQIPFIQKTLPQAKIVPIVMGFQTQNSIATLVNALAEVLPGKNALVIASTDLSHYLPKTRARDIDSKTISLIQSFKTNLLLRKLQQGENIMCGGTPVVTTLLYAQKRGTAKVVALDYSDSMKCGSPESRVVGYFSAAIYRDVTNPNFNLSQEEKEELLHLARSSIRQYIQGKSIIEYQTQNHNFLTKKGAFVTLKKEGHLRGCIGYIEPVLPLYQTVIQAAVYAACKDQRFPPVSASEIRNLEIEISVLSPLKKIRNPNLIKVGKHGLVISKGNKKGLLLPQVPVENNWTRETYLQRACLKAGLPPDAWKSGSDIFTFEAFVFK